LEDFCASCLGVGSEGGVKTGGAIARYDCIKQRPGTHWQTTFTWASDAKHRNKATLQLHYFNMFKHGKGTHMIYMYMYT
jgi:hypothetical protein